VAFADVLVGAVAVPGERTPVLLTRDLLSRMRPGRAEAFTPELPRRGPQRRGPGL